jgi:hypothetical protein
MDALFENRITDANALLGLIGIYWLFPAVEEKGGPLAGISQLET